LTDKVPIMPGILHPSTGQFKRLLLRDRLGQHGIGIHSLRKTAINDAIRGGAAMYEVRKFAGLPVRPSRCEVSVTRSRDSRSAAMCPAVH
jgi:hypothetical protein